MTIKAARFITQLMAEIAERDARIAELEAQAGEGTSSNKYRAELYDEVWQAAREMGYGNVTSALQELAALKSQQPSAGVVDDRAAFDEWFNDFSLSVRMNGGQMNDAQMFAAWQARARLDQPTASAGVVIGALVSALEGIVHDERVPNEVSQDYAALLIEARRLNPCRAQAVPDGWVMVPVEPTGEMEQFICNCDVRNGAITGDYLEWQQCYKAMLAAAPSAKKEG